MKLYRVRNESEYGEIRPLKGSVPATCRLFLDEKLKVSGSAKLPTIWQVRTRLINSAKAWRYLTAPKGGYVNQGKWPQIQYVTFESNPDTDRTNYFLGEPLNNSIIRVITNKYSDLLPLKEYTVHWWWNINRNGVLTPGATYKDHARIIMVSPLGYLFVPAYRLIEVK